VNKRGPRVIGDGLTTHTALRDVDGRRAQHRWVYLRAGCSSWLTGWQAFLALLVGINNNVVVYFQMNSSGGHGQRHGIPIRAGPFLESLGQHPGPYPGGS